LSDWSWCDVNFADSRGWVYAADLGYPYQNNRMAIIEYGPRLGLPVVAFSLPAYWDAHYRGRPWYRERDVWVNRVHAEVDRGGRPPESGPARTAQPSPGGSAASPSAGRTPQPGQAPPPQPQAAQPPQASQSAQSARPAEARPPEGRPPESAGRPESAPASEKGGQQQGQGQAEGRGAAGGPDRDKQQ
jgi:hypothetical protein